jgi:threonine/homoserine/homoserine lactone efflux protein
MVGGERRLFGDVELIPHSQGRRFAMGLTTCLLNPKIALLFAALLPQFVDPDSGSVPVQIVILGLVQVAVGGLVNGMWVLLSSGVKRLLETRRRAGYDFDRKRDANGGPSAGGDCCVV